MKILMGWIRSLGVQMTCCEKQTQRDVDHPKSFPESKGLVSVEELRCEFDVLPFKETAQRPVPETTAFIIELYNL